VQARSKAKAPNKSKIVVLNGSPRKQGNTVQALHFLEKELSPRAQIQRHDLYAMKYRGCSHCDGCKKNKALPGCKLKDELQKPLADILQAEGIVVASPVYCWSVSGCLSAALDRFYCLFREEQSLLQGKKIASVFTAGGDAFDGMELCVEMMKKLSLFGGASYVGTLTAASCTSPEEIARRRDLKKAAQQLAKNLLT
jgi:multimeric flavodoxin WrbA